MHTVYAYHNGHKILCPYNPILEGFQDQVLVVYFVADLLLEVGRYCDGLTVAAIDRARHAAHDQRLMHNRHAVTIPKCINGAFKVTGLSAIEQIVEPCQVCRRSLAEEFYFFKGGAFFKGAGVVIGTGEEQDEGQGEIFFHGLEVGGGWTTPGEKRLEMEAISSNMVF